CARWHRPTLWGTSGTRRVKNRSGFPPQMLPRQKALQTLPDMFPVRSSGHLSVLNIVYCGMKDDEMPEQAALEMLNQTALSDAAQPDTFRCYVNQTLLVQPADRFFETLLAHVQQHGYGFRRAFVAQGQRPVVGFQGFQDHRPIVGRFTCATHTQRYVDLAVL